MEENKLELWKRIFIVVMFPLLVLLSIIEPIYLGLKERSFACLITEWKENFSTLYEIYTETIWE